MPGNACYHRLGKVSPDLAMLGQVWEG